MKNIFALLLFTTLTFGLACKKQNAVKFTGNLIVTSSTVDSIFSLSDRRSHNINGLTVGLYDPSVQISGDYSNPISTTKFDNKRAEFDDINLGNYIVALQSYSEWNKIVQVKASEDVQIDLFQ